MEKTQVSGKFVTSIGLTINLLLIGAKLTAGILGKSAAMIADAVHSISDAVTDLMVIVGFNIAEKPADSCHRYGHGKAETFVTLTISMLLFFTAFGIAGSGAEKIYSTVTGNGIEPPLPIAFYAALISILFKEVLFRYTISMGRKLNSKALLANAWHQRTDALSSVAAALGIGGALLFGEKMAILDPLAAIVTAFLIIIAAWPLLRESVDELMEKNLGIAVESRIFELVNSVEGATAPHNLKTRRIGKRMAVDIHIRVARHLSIVEAHDIATQVEKILKNNFGESTFVNVHIEPEPDRNSQ